MVPLATPSGAKPYIDLVSDAIQHIGGDEAAYRRAKDFFANDPSTNQGRTLGSVIEEGLEALDLAGAKTTVGPDFEPHVIVDRELITGQNPRSDHSIAAKLIEALNGIGRRVEAPAL